MRERELREQMRLQLRLDDEAARLEAESEIQRRIQEEKDQVLQLVTHLHILKNFFFHIEAHADKFYQRFHSFH